MYLMTVLNVKMLVIGIAINIDTSMQKQLYSHFVHKLRNFVDITLFVHRYMYITSFVHHQNTDICYVCLYIANVLFYFIHGIL